MLKTIWINIGVYFTTFIWTVIGILISPIAYGWFRWKTSHTTTEITRKMIWLYGYVWVRVVSLFISIETTSSNPPSPCIFAINHASFFDTYLIGVLPVWNLCIAVRDWPFRIFFYRPFMEAAGYIKTEQTTPDAIINKSLKALELGSTLFFYPEGTRTHDGQLGRFRSGAFHIAMKANVPIVPVCISGSFKLLPRKKWIITPANIKVRLLPPVYPDRYQQAANGHIAMRKDVKECMTQALNEMGTSPN